MSQEYPGISRIYGAADALLEESMQNEILLEMKNIRKEFPGVVAVNDVSMDIRKGEVHICLLYTSRCV